MSPLKKTSLLRSILVTRKIIKKYTIISGAVKTGKCLFSSLIFFIYVKGGNSLTEPICENDTDENYWFTPMYFSEVWQTRMALKKMKTLFEE